MDKELKACPLHIGDKVQIVHGEQWTYDWSPDETHTVCGITWDHHLGKFDVWLILQGDTAPTDDFTVESLRIVTRTPAATVEREGLEQYLLRAVYDDQPHKAISPALAKQTGIPLGETIPFDVAIAAGWDFCGNLRTIRAILTALRADHGELRAEVERLRGGVLDLQSLIDSLYRDVNAYQQAAKHCWHGDEIIPNAALTNAVNDIQASLQRVSSEKSFRAWFDAALTQGSK